MTLGEVIREAYVAAGLRQADVAMACDVGQTAVSDWVIGRYEPRLAQIAAIEDLCGLERGQVLERSGHAVPLGVVPAIRRDRHLSSEQKRLLIEMYHASVTVEIEPDLSRPEVRAIMALERLPIEQRLRLVAELQDEPQVAETDSRLVG